MVWVKAIIDPKLYMHVVGNVIRLWGHDFVVQQDGSLCMEMHPEFIDAEARAGRIRRLSTPPPGTDFKKLAEKVTIVTPDVPEDTVLTMDIGNYYGVGTLEDLLKKVKTMKNKAIAEFAKKRFPKEKKLAINMKKDDMVDKIRSFIDSKMIKVAEED